MNQQTRAVLTHLQHQGGVGDISGFKLHGNTRVALLSQGWIEERTPSIWTLTEAGAKRLQQQEGRMAKQPRDGLRFKVLDVLNRKGALLHREVAEHLRLDPASIFTELERMKADAEVTQTGARGPYQLTPSGKEAIKALLVDPVGNTVDVDAVLAIAQRISEKEAAKANVRQRHADALRHATGEVEAAAQLLSKAQAALNELRMAQHNEEANLDDEIQALRGELGRRVR